MSLGEGIRLAIGISANQEVTITRIYIHIKRINCNCIVIGSKVMTPIQKYEARRLARIADSIYQKKEIRKARIIRRRHKDMKEKLDRATNNLKVIRIAVDNTMLSGKVSESVEKLFMSELHKAIDEVSP